MSVTIVLVYQSLLGVYSDRGNAMVLRKRLAWRGIDAELLEVAPGDPLPPDGTIYLLGGGEDAVLPSVVKHLISDGNLFKAVDAGAVLFSVCAGYQLTGKTFTLGGDDTVIEGLGLLDVESRRGSERAVGEILTCWTKPDGSQSLLTGFENHGGFSYLGESAQPLAQVEIGIGNSFGGTEGAVQGRIVGTYLHGPVLARNPELADYLLETALERKLDPLPSGEIDELRQQRITSIRKQGLRR